MSVEPYLEELENIKELVNSDAWDTISPLWNMMNQNVMLTGHKKVNRYILYALAVHIMNNNKKIKELEKEIETLKKINLKDL